MFVEPGAKVNSQLLLMRRFLAKGSCMRPSKVCPVQVDAAATRRGCGHANGQDSPDGATVGNEVTKPGVN